MSGGPSAASLHGSASATSVGGGAATSAGAARAAASPQRSVSAAAAVITTSGDSRTSTVSGMSTEVAPRDVSTAPSASNGSSGGSGGGGGSGTAVGRSLSANEAGRERLRAALFGPEPEILALRFDPLKKVIITAGTDKTIKVGVVRVWVMAWE